MIFIHLRRVAPPAFAPAIQYMKAIAIGIATIAALFLNWNTYPAAEPASQEQVTRAAWIWIAVIVLGSILMVVYYIPRGR